LQDAHNCCLDFDENVSQFAVYDGHGGHEVYIVPINEKHNK